MSYHRPIRITVEDAELINEMPSNSTTPSTSTQNTEDTQNTENTFDSAKSPQIDFERPIINLNDKIQYRVATISFSSGSSQVSISGRKKIKKIDFFIWFVKNNFFFHQ